MPITRGRDRGAAMPSQNIYDRSATAKQRVGERLQIADRTFYYGKVSTTVARGQLLAPDQSDGGPWLISIDGSCVAITAANRQLGDTTKAITAALAVGDTGIGVTHATYLAGIVAHQLQDGYIFLNDTGGVSQYYKIKDNTAVSAVTTNVVEILLYDEVQAVTVDASCSVSVMQNPWMNLALADGDVDEFPSGGAMAVGTTTYPYVWVQTWGPGCAYATGTGLAGHQMVLSTNAGQVAIAAGSYLPIVGTAISDAETTGDYIAINWQLFP